MWETWVRPLGWEDPVEKEKATHSRGLENSGDCTVHVVTKSWTGLSDFHFHFIWLPKVLVVAHGIFYLSRCMWDLAP